MFNSSSGSKNDKSFSNSSYLFDLSIVTSYYVGTVDSSARYSSSNYSARAGGSELSTLFSVDSYFLFSSV